MLRSTHELIRNIPLKPITIPPSGRPWTAADLLALADEENRYEIAQGELIVMAPASPVQGRFAMSLSYALYGYVREHQLGEVYVSEPGFELQSEPALIIRSPDVAFVRQENIPPASEQAGFWKLAPDLAVEIISPSETATQVQAKVQDYLTAGVRLIWLVYPSTKIVIEYRSATEIRQLGLKDTLTGGEVIPGFRYPVKELFR